MYVRIGQSKYTRISDLKFDPETDITGSTVPVNELWVSIRTEDTIPLGTHIALYDDTGKRWCRYWVVYAEREDRHTVRVRGESSVSRLEAKDMPAKMYQGETADVVIDGILRSKFGDNYILEPSLAGTQISGFAPEQTARERLQWVCMVIGAYVRNYFDTKLEILDVDDQSTVLIPIEDTYYKPKVAYDDYVTAIRAKYYSYEETVPSRTDTYVEAGNKTYVQTETTITLTNDSVPSGARDNVAELEGVTLINASNVSAVMNRLAKYMFNRTSVTIEARNNGDYIPGMRVYAYADESTVVQGYIQSCSFSFGLQAKASMALTPIEIRETGLVKVSYLWGDRPVAIRAYFFPVGYSFSITNEYIRTSFGGHTYIFRPKNESATGTTRAGTTVVNQQVELALDLHDGDLHLYSVDMATKSDDTLVIA